MIGDKIREFKKQKNTKIGQGYYDNRVKASLTTSYKGYYPSTFLENKLNKRGGKSISDEIITYFIKTYSNEGDTILDMCCHNKVVGNLVKPLNRNYIGVDINEIKD